MGGLYTQLMIYGWLTFNLWPFEQIRGLSIDQAITQLEFNDKKGAKIVKEVKEAESRR